MSSASALATRSGDPMGAYSRICSSVGSLATGISRSTDLSSSVVAAARTGLYGMERINGISQKRLQKYCLKGSGDYQGKMLMSRELRAKVRFEQANLMDPFSPQLRLGKFDVIFLRNVLIYFDLEAKQAIVGNVLKHLGPHGFFFTGHAETLTGVTWELAAVQPAVYERAG